MLDGRKAVWSIPYVSVAFFPSLKQNSIAYRSSKVSSHPDCIFEIHQLWQLVFSRVYSNCCCSCWLELKIIKIGQSSYKMYSGNIVNFQESTTILNACTKKSGNLLNSPHMYVIICLYVYYINAQLMILYKKSIENHEEKYCQWSLLMELDMFWESTVNVVTNYA